MKLISPFRSPGLALAAFVLAIFVSGPVHAAKKVRVPDGGTPSAKLDPLLTPCLDAIAEPLEKKPKMPRVEVEKLHASLAADQVAAETPHQREIFANAMAVCDALTKGMDERAKEEAAAQAGAKAPKLSTGGGIIKSSPIRGRDAGANAEAIRKKQRDERGYADKDAGTNATFVESGTYKAWTEKATLVRQNVMALYTRQKQLEAYEAKATAEEKHAETPADKTPAVAQPQSKPQTQTSEAKPVPAVTKQTPTTSESAYIGKWVAEDNPELNFVTKADHTVIKTAKNGHTAGGKWSLEPGGKFVLSWDAKGGNDGHLTPDGKALKLRNGNWVRQ